MPVASASSGKASAGSLEFSSNVNAECADTAINPGLCAPGSGEAQGTNDTSDTSTDGFGGTLQFTLLAPISRAREHADCGRELRRGPDPLHPV